MGGVLEDSESSFLIAVTSNFGLIEFDGKLFLNFLPATKVPSSLSLVHGGCPTHLAVSSVSLCLLPSFQMFHTRLGSKWKVTHTGF